MFVRFKLTKSNKNLLDNYFYKQVDINFPQYIIEYFDTTKIVLKRKVFLGHSYGENVRYATNLIKHFEVKERGNELELLVNVNHALFTIAVSFVGLLMFCVIYDCDIFWVGILAFIVILTVLYIVYQRVKCIIKMFRALLYK